MEKLLIWCISFANLPDANKKSIIVYIEKLADLIKRRWIVS